VLRRRGRTVARASIDDFHRPQEERYRQGELSPRGYYEDSFDLAAVQRFLLDTDADVTLFDGVFLLRPELFDSWDLRIFVSARFEEILRRALERDVARFGARGATAPDTSPGRSSTSLQRVRRSGPTS
jgi:uridine kinase